MENLALLSKRLAELEGVSCVLQDGGESQMILSSPLKMHRLGCTPFSVEQLALTTPSEICDISSGQLVGAHLHPNERNVLVALRSGELVLFSADLSGGWLGEVMGSFEAGITAFATSPDHELVALTTEKGQLVLLSRFFFSVVHEVSLAEAVANFHGQQVSVGWGRKETQFHGTAGKQAALAKIPVEERLSDADDGRVSISWRADSAYFVCSFVLATGASPHRQLVVVGRDGHLSSVNEPTELLGQTVGWGPERNLIAVNQRASDGKNRIVFFERNGLRHGEFVLHDHTSDVVSLDWNADGSILALSMSDGRVDLWTTCNYHWYHKHTVLPEGSLSKVFWDRINAQRLFLISASGHLAQHEFVSRFCSSLCASDDNLSLTAVVDGPQILLTPFAIANVPPPMSYAQVSVGFVANCLAVLCKGVSARLAAVSAQGSMVVLRVSAAERGRMHFKEHLVVETGVCIKQVSFLNEDCIYGLAVDGRVLIIDATGHVRFVEGISREPAVICCRGKRLLLQDYEGVLYDGLSLEMLAGFGDFCPWFDFFVASGAVQAIGRTAGGCVVGMEGVKISANCRSFFLHPEFLCTSNPEGLISFFPLALPMQQWATLKAEREENSRLSEGGARILACSSTSASLVLQMARGNLETVYPRAFVLSQVRRLLDSLAYREAFLSCRRHRLDLNIIHDHNPELFMATMGKFIEQVGETEYINLFISSLRDENVVATRYSSLFPQKETTACPKTFEGKTNLICDRVRALLSSEPVKYAECIVTCFVCSSPPNHSAALEEIVSLGKRAGDGKAVERALKYLLFLVPAEKLYRAALGMYNLPLALSVARRSQMDPSEYVEFLQDLQHTEPAAYRRFRIDDFLERQQAALHSLIASGRPFDECLSYIARHQLYRAAFEIYRGKDSGACAGTEEEEWRTVCRKFAEDQAEHGSLRAATDLYCFAGDTESARGCAIKMGYWQKIVCLATGEGERREDCRCVVPVLLEQRRGREAVMVAEVYVDADFALETAIAAGLWGEAQRVARGNSLNGDALVAAALAQGEQTVREAGEIGEGLGEKAARLELLLEQLVQMLDPERIRECLERDTEGGEIAEGMSEMSFGTATTATSFLGSQFSVAASSRSRRKADRQRMRGKPGSPFEREYLREGIRDLVHSLAALHGTTQDLLQLLCDEQCFEAARTVQTALAEVTEKTRLSCERIRRLVSVQEERLRPETLFSLGQLPWTIPQTVQVDHAWRTAFDLPAVLAAPERIPYL